MAWGDGMCGWTMNDGPYLFNVMIRTLLFPS